MTPERAKIIRETWEKGRDRAEKYLQKEPCCVLYHYEPAPIVDFRNPPNVAGTIETFTYCVQGPVIVCEGIIVEHLA